MVNMGIDVGSEYVKVAILDDHKVVGLATVTTGVDQLASAKEAVKQALEKAKITMESVQKIKTTGAGRKAVVSISSSEMNEMASAAAGAAFFFPAARTVIDAGAEEARAISLDGGGKIRDFALNEKCAAGAGSFTESMAKALEISLEQLAKGSLDSTKKIAMNAQCVVFAESEVVSLIHSGATVGDISRAVHDAIADRISAVARRVGLVEPVALVGGMGRNAGFVDSLKRTLNMDILVPPDPEYVSAIGAAVSN